MQVACERRYFHINGKQGKTKSKYIKIMYRSKDGSYNYGYFSFTDLQNPPFLLPFHLITFDIHNFLIFFFIFNAIIM